MEGKMMSTKVLMDIAMAALVGAMQQAIQHYFPWGLVFRRELPRVVAYIIGTLAYLIPVTVLYAHWAMIGIANNWSHLIALWACVAASGLSVILVRVVDWALERITRSFEHEERDDAKRNE
jgi:hypothetical protein